MSKASFSENADISNQLINRELSWLQFNDRVLEESKDETNPLFERVKFLSIAGTNLDEFFMVRVAGLFNQIKDGFDELSADGLTAEEQLNRVVLKTKDLLEKQNEAFLGLKKELSKEKIFIRKISELNKKDLMYLREYFQETIYPIITPTAIDPSHPFPFIPNKGQAILLRMSRIKKKRELNAIIVIPRVLPKFISLNDSETVNEFVTIDDVICKFANEIFPDHNIEASLQFKIIRDSEIEIDDEAADLVRYFEKAIKKRRRGNVVKLEVLTNSNKSLLKFISKKFKMKEDHIYEVEGLVGIQDLDEICKKKDPKLRFKKFNPREVERLKEFDDKFFSAIRSKDFVVHHPFETFDVVIQYLEAAAKDPEVIGIKQTL